MGDEQPKTTKPPWQGIAWLVSGLVLALGASFLAQYFDLGRRFTLDFKGKRVIGIAERMGDDYNIRYKHSDGTIFRRLYKGKLSEVPTSEGKFEVALVFDPREPNQFQPAGLSYLPGVAALTLFILGMASVFKGRKVMHAHYLAATGKPDAGKPGKRGAGPGREEPALARRKQLRIALTLALAFALIVLIYGCPQFNIPGLFKN